MAPRDSSGLFSGREHDDRGQTRSAHVHSCVYSQALIWGRSISSHADTLTRSGSPSVPARLRQRCVGSAGNNRRPG